MAEVTLAVTQGVNNYVVGGSFVFPSGDEEVDRLVGVQHLSGPLGSGDGSQLKWKRSVKSRNCLSPFSKKCLARETSDLLEYSQMLLRNRM
ncbi:hypothetical protein EYF80_011010 [Liparis tanakae]|uniref:Uncharacterized protein n=1 Tax=Liparis tanakae TaxID=230148 RepID=A0A4Z2ILB1_9TELE|nr:hypothetical protein EYF80_011010 [Liparis tanakae]